MSFEVELQEAAIVALQAVEGTNGVFLERPARATPPYLVLGEMLSADWSAKGAIGREVRLQVRVHDAGEGWSRTAALQGAAGAAIEALPRQIGTWRLGAVVLLRARTAREGSGGWLGTVEYRIRAMEG